MSVKDLDLVKMMANITDEFDEGLFYIVIMLCMGMAETDKATFVELAVYPRSLSP
jgi:hypothetical protein